MSYIMLRVCWFHIIVLNIDDVKDSLYEEQEHVFYKFSKYNMDSLLGDFSTKLGKENIFKLTIGNETLHKIVIIVELEYYILSHLKVSVMKYGVPTSQHPSIYLKSPDGKTHNRIDPILIDRQRHSSVLHVQFRRAADFDPHDWPLVANIRERLAVNKQSSHRFCMEMFSLK
jgi:hypothetical protein